MRRGAYERLVEVDEDVWLYPLAYLLLAGAISGALAELGIEVALAFLAGLGAAGVLAARSLPEVTAPGAPCTCPSGAAGAAACAVPTATALRDTVAAQHGHR